MEKQDDFKGFLNDEGEVIFQALRSHCRDKLKLMEVDDFELAMLANSFALYAKNAKYCNEEGTTMVMQTKTGDYEMLRPEYAVMKNEYQNILKHSSKFGLNPGDRAKFFKGVGAVSKKKGFNLGADKMKVA